MWRAPLAARRRWDGEGGRVGELIEKAESRRGMRHPAFGTRSVWPLD
jgi:hypothetical protein